MKNILAAYARKVWKDRLIVGIAACILAAALLLLYGYGIGTVILGALLSGIFAAAIAMVISLGIRFALGVDI